MSESWARSRRYRAPKQESYQQPREDLWPRDWQPQPESHARHEAERKRERTRRLKQLQAEAEDRVLRQLAEERRLFEERSRLREYELRQQEEEALYHSQQALYEDEQTFDEFAYDDIPTPRVRSHYSPAHHSTAPYDLARDQDRYRRQRKIEMDRRMFNEYYPGREFDEELALQEDSAEDELPAEFPIVVSFGKVQRELTFVPGMTEAELLDYIGEAFPDLPLNLLNGLRPHGEGWAVPLDACCEQPEFLFRNPQLALALHASAGQTSYEENTEEEEEEVYEDETQEDEVVFDEREFFMTQEESDAVEALIEARDPAVQLAYEAYPQLSKLVNAFVRIIRMLTVPQEGEEEEEEEDAEEEEEQAEPEDDAFDSLLTKTIDWMVKQKLITDAQAEYLLELALSHDPELLDEIRQTASLEDLIQHLRTVANQEAAEERTEEGSSQVPRIDAEVLHTVFEKLTNEDVDDEVMTAAMDLITRNDNEAMRAIWAYADHRDWSHLLQTLEALVEARKNDPESHKTEMHQELRDQILAMRARILAHRQVLEDKRAAHQQNASRDGAPDEEGEKLENELSRISKQLEELDTLLQNQLSQLDNAAQGLDTVEQDADLDGLKNLVAVLSMDPSIGASEARWVKKFIEEMNSDFLDAYFEFQEHQSYDQYKERLLELIRSAEGVETEPEGDDDLDEPSDPSDEFAQKVLKLLYKGQLLKSKDRQLLARLVEVKDPFVMDAFEQLNVHNDWNKLHEALMSRLSLASGALNGNVEEDEEEYEWEGDEGDSLQED